MSGIPRDYPRAPFDGPMCKTCGGPSLHLRDGAIGPCPAATPTAPPEQEGPRANYVRVDDPDYVPPKVTVTYTDCYTRSDLEAVAMATLMDWDTFRPDVARKRAERVVTRYLASRTPEAPSDTEGK